MSMGLSYEGGDRFRLSVRDHELILDQPVELGGLDAGPTPTELFVAGFAACVGFYGERFLRRHGISTEGFRVEVDHELSEGRPARVGRIDVRVVVPAGIPDERRRAFERVIDHCTLHNTLRDPPAIRISVNQTATVA